MANLKQVLIFGIAAFLIMTIGCSKSNGNNGNPPNYDNFAKCLTDNGVKFYGAFWCPHCANQKEMFGKSFENIDYIECSLPDKSGQTQVCINAKIKAYPTWEFKDGLRIEGEQTLLQLSQKSGCKME